MGIKRDGLHAGEDADTSRGAKVQRVHVRPGPHAGLDHGQPDFQPRTLIGRPKGVLGVLALSTDFSTFGEWVRFKGVSRGLCFAEKFGGCLEVSFEGSVKGANFGMYVSEAFVLVRAGFDFLKWSFVAGCSPSSLLLRGGGGGIQSVSSPLPQRCVVTG